MTQETHARAEYRETISVSEAARLVAGVAPGPAAGAGEAEAVPLVQAFGRVVAEPIRAAERVPGFDRSTVDGYAVAAGDTYGAGEAAPVLLSVVGEVKMGHPAELALSAGQAVAVPTGGMLPGGADAVVMVEYTSDAGAGYIEVTRPVAPRENVVGAGDDVDLHDIVLPAGRRITTADTGVLAAVGVVDIPCRPKPRVAVIPTGDEIIPPSSEVCRPGQVRDITSAALAAMITRDGGLVRVLDIVPDREGALEDAVGSAIRDFDLVLILGGSSVGARDHTAGIIQRYGPPGLIFHGLALKPGKPTIFGLAGDIPVFGLPGHPVSSLVVYQVLVRPLLRRLEGEAARPALEPSLRALMTTAVSSDQGREEYLCVTLRRSETAGGEPELLAEPVYGKSGLITMLARADGLVRIPAGSRGLEAGSAVEVTPLD